KQELLDMINKESEDDDKEIDNRNVNKMVDKMVDVNKIIDE
ncbi:3909_t:CDS:1, partial [Dentiscutata heterogama]